MTPIQTEFNTHVATLHALGLPLLDAIAELRARFAGEVSLTQAHEWAATAYRMLDEHPLQMRDHDVARNARALYDALIVLGWKPPA